jgi:hypothetical protein
MCLLAIPFVLGSQRPLGFGFATGLQVVDQLLAMFNLLWIAGYVQVENPMVVCSVSELMFVMYYITFSGAI